MSTFNVLDSHKAFAQAILCRWESYKWTTMGFGMIRTYLDGNSRWRLNIWDDRLIVPNVSTIHDHPWSFTSFVIAGELHNRRYTSKDTPVGIIRPTHLYHRIITGEDGGKFEEPTPCRLVHKNLETEVYRAGESYYQEMTEVHETHYLRGTVTLNDRTPPTKEHTARVFWPLGREWVDAKPRIAERSEVAAAVTSALQLLD